MHLNYWEKNTFKVIWDKTQKGMPRAWVIWAWDDIRDETVGRIPISILKRQENG